MFYYLIRPLMSYDTRLIAAAVIPAVILMIKVYRSDRLERESTGMLIKLIIAGFLATVLAIIEERILIGLLGACVPAESPYYNIILYFGIVAVAEETSKFILLNCYTWRSYEFNCQYDGVVYAVFVSLGFALLENIFYVLQYGFVTAFIRAVTAIPGHACFGVFMGIFYGIAKKYHYSGNYILCRFFRLLSIIVPIGLHGAYDYIATMEEQSSGDTVFITFIVILFAVSYLLVGRMSRNDRYIT